MSSLPTPSLSATITTPSAFGEKKRRKRVVCQRCGVEGHNKSNRKHHPSPL